MSKLQKRTDDVDVLTVFELSKLTALDFLQDRAALPPTVYPRFVCCLVPGRHIRTPMFDEITL